MSRSNVVAELLKYAHIFADMSCPRQVNELPALGECIFRLYRVRKNCVLKLLGVIEKTEINNFCKINTDRK